MIDAFSAVLHQLFGNTALITYALPSYKIYEKKLRDAFSELWEILFRSARDLKASEILVFLMLWTSANRMQGSN